MDQSVSNCSENKNINDLNYNVETTASRIEPTVLTVNASEIVDNTPHSDSEMTENDVNNMSPSSTHSALHQSSESLLSPVHVQDPSTDSDSRDDASISEKNSSPGSQDSSFKSSKNAQTCGQTDVNNFFNVDSDSDELENEIEQSVSDNKNCQEVLSKNNGKKHICLESGKLEFESIVKQYETRIQILENKNESLQNEVLELKRKLQSQELAFRKSESEIRAGFLSNLEKLSRECNVLRKEKEAIVIRYANSEKEVIMEKKVQQDLEKKLKDIIKERDALALKLKNAGTENSRLSSCMENKMVEIVKLQKENEKLNADFNSREIRIKWLQNKLKCEINSHKETQVKLDHTMQRLNEMREEAEQVRRDCQEMIKCYQEAEEIKSVKLDSQLKQKLSELEVQKQEKCDQEQVYQLLRQELEALKKKQRMSMDENNSLTLKIHSLEKERLEYEQTLSKLKDSQNLLKQEVVDLTARLAEMESLRLQLEREREKSAASLREVERLRSTNAELQADMDACHVKEGELLEFTEKLTAKTVHLQSDHCLLEVKAQALEDEIAQVKKQLSDMQQKYLQLAVEEENAKKEREEEMQLLARKLAEKTKNVERLNTKLDEAENENRVLKRRHIASIKELSRELYQCRRRLESYESSNCIRAESASLGSRTSSTASLDVLSSNGNRIYLASSSPSVSFSGNKGATNQVKNSNSNAPAELDKEMLIERIIKLQSTLARKNDKIEFLEDHIDQLVKEMRKKAKSVDFKTV